MNIRKGEKLRPQLNGISSSNTAWNQPAINAAFAALVGAYSGREVHYEKLWQLMRKEVLGILKSELKDDVAVDEAEYIAYRELNYRLTRGNVKYISKSYIRRYICGTAIRFVRTRHARVVPIDTDDDESAFELKDPSSNPDEMAWLRFADLYFCFEKLTPDDKRLMEMLHYSDLDMEIAAQELGLNYNTLCKRHSRALQKLRLCLEDGGKVN